MGGFSCSKWLKKTIYYDFSLIIQKFGLNLPRKKFSYKKICKKKRKKIL